jgi:hypothetical protein
MEESVELYTQRVDAGWKAFWYGCCVAGLDNDSEKQKKK